METYSSLIKNIKIMNKLFKILFPFYYYNNSKISEKQKEYIDNLDEKFGLLGMEIVELEYELKTNGRSYFLDLFKSNTFILIFIILLIFLIVSAYKSYVLYGI